MIRDWLVGNVKEPLLLDEEGELSIHGLATYQPYDGLMDLKMVSKSSLLSFSKSINFINLVNIGAHSSSLCF